MSVNIKSIDKALQCTVTNEKVVLTLNYIDDRIKTEPKVESCDLFVASKCTANLREFRNCPYSGKLQNELT
jgi:hypothetical protein